MNSGYIAHIIAEKPCGPRGDTVRSSALANDPKNLMLLCDSHHRLIDREELNNYPEERLLEMKFASEERIKLATEVAPDRASHILRFAATVGVNEPVISIPNCKAAMLGTHFPASHESIDLSLSGLSLPDSDPEYFRLQAQNLKRQFDAKVRGRLEAQEISHLSVFALAPIPLLIELGRLLSDISPASVYQLHREPAGWDWAQDSHTLPFTETVPENSANTVALKLGISANITNDRIRAAVGDDTAIWSIEAEAPHNDCVRSPTDLIEFRRRLRTMLNDIKRVHGESTVLNVFPAVPVSAAVELGRVWMPKADLPLMIFDQSNNDNGFAPRLLIK